MDLNSLDKIKSQKEEIERNEERFKELLRSRISEDNAKIWELEAEVESLKAITELALKENGNYKAQLKNAEAKEFAYDNLRKRFDLAVKGLNQIMLIRDWNVDAPDFLMVQEARSTLSEIERLQNEQEGTIGHNRKNEGVYMPLYTCHVCKMVHMNPDMWKLCFESHYPHLSKK